MQTLRTRGQDWLQSYLYNCSIHAWTLRPRKKETLFMGGRTHQAGLVDLDIFFFPPFWCQKKSLQNIWCFLEKNFRKINFQLFSKNFQSNFLRLWPKMADFTWFQWGGGKNLQKWKIWVSRTRKTGVEDASICTCWATAILAIQLAYDNRFSSLRGQVLAVRGL